MAVVHGGMTLLQLESQRLSLLPAHIDSCVWDVGEIQYANDMSRRTNEFHLGLDRLETFPADAVGGAMIASGWGKNIALAGCFTNSLSWILP